MGGIHDPLSCLAFAPRPPKQNAQSSLLCDSSPGGMTVPLGTQGQSADSHCGLSHCRARRWIPCLFLQALSPLCSARRPRRRVECSVRPCDSLLASSGVPIALRSWAPIPTPNTRSVLGTGHCNSLRQLLTIYRFAEGRKTSLGGDQ